MDTSAVVALVGSFFLFVAMPAIISFSIYHEKKLKLKRDLAKAGGEQVHVELAATRAEVRRLHERMIVLERLLTDDDRKLANEIARLQQLETTSRV